MYSLIVALLGIVLVSITGIATLYYGGYSFKSSNITEGDTTSTNLDKIKELVDLLVKKQQ